jgi:hypothetical protein
MREFPKSSKYGVALDSKERNTKCLDDQFKAFLKATYGELQLILAVNSRKKEIYSIGM